MLRSHRRLAGWAGSSAMDEAAGTLDDEAVVCFWRGEPRSEKDWLVEPEVVWRRGSPVWPRTTRRPHRASWTTIAVYLIVCGLCITV